MTGFVAWACRTPRRLVLVAGVPLLLVILLGSLWRHSGDGAAPGGDAGGGANPAVSAVVPDSTSFVSAAVKFVGVWGHLAPGQSAAQWHDAVRGLTTPDLGQRLAVTDPASLTGAAVSGQPQVRFLASTSALVAVPMANGRTVLVTVVRGDGKAFLVDDVEPDVGN